MHGAHLLVPFELHFKVLTLEKTQINLVFSSLNRTFETYSKVLSFENAKKKQVFFLHFAHLLDKFLTLGRKILFFFSHLIEIFVPLPTNY